MPHKSDCHFHYKEGNLDPTVVQPNVHRLLLYKYMYMYSKYSNLLLQHGSLNKLTLSEEQPHSQMPWKSTKTAPNPLTFILKLPPRNTNLESHVAAVTVTLNSTYVKIRVSPRDILQNENHLYAVYLTWNTSLKTKIGQPDTEKGQNLSLTDHGHKPRGQTNQHMCIVGTSKVWRYNITLKPAASILHNNTAILVGLIQAQK